MIILFGINNCDTIKKTRKLLDEQSIDYQFHDYKKTGCSYELAEQFLEHFTYQQLINTRGTTWRKLPETLKHSLNRESAVKLMVEQPSIIKRPIINSGKQWLLGFDRESLAQLRT